MLPDSNPTGGKFTGESKKRVPKNAQVQGSMESLCADRESVRTARECFRTASTSAGSAGSRGGSNGSVKNEIQKDRAGTHRDDTCGSRRGNRASVQPGAGDSD